MTFDIIEDGGLEHGFRSLCDFSLGVVHILYNTKMLIFDNPPPLYNVI